LKTALSPLLCITALCLTQKGYAADTIYITTSKNGRPVYTSAPLSDASVLLMRISSREQPSGRSPDFAPQVVHSVARSELNSDLAPPPRKKNSVVKAGLLPVVERIASEYGINPALVMAVITVESSFNAKAVSNKGAGGLMQLMPGTARRYGVLDVFDAEQNIRGGVRYLNDLATMFNNDLDLILAAYNAGENAVLRYKNAIPPYKETINYVKQVRHHFLLSANQ
jgi:soluble lytic murein transglycosylase-like protein